METIIGDLMRQLNRANSKIKGTINEVEVRVGHKDRDGRFRPQTTDLQEFDLFMTRLKKMYTVERKTILSVSLEPERKEMSRARVIIEDNTEDMRELRNFCMTDIIPESAVYQRKLQLETLNVDNGLKTTLDEKGTKTIRVSFANEVPITSEEEIEKINTAVSYRGQSGVENTSGYKAMKTYRYMQRYVFSVGDHVKIMCSVVKSKAGMYFRSSGVLETEEQYERELEFEDVEGEDVEAMVFRSDIFRQFLEFFQGGKIVDFATLSAFSARYNSLNLPKAPNIGVLDSMEKIDRDLVYVVDKTDGVRSYLVYDNNTGQFYRITNNSIYPMGLAKSAGVSRLGEGLTIFDGEYLDRSQAGNDEFGLFMIFDILFKGGRDLRDVDYFLSPIGEAKPKTKGAKEEPGEKEKKSYRVLELSVFDVAAGKSVTNNLLIILDDIYVVPKFPSTLFTLDYVKFVGPEEGVGTIVYQLPDDEESLQTHIHINGDGLTERKFVYNIDGLVVQKYDVKYPKTGEIWEGVYKWKPTGKITNDFLVKRADKKLYSAEETPLGEFGSQKYFKFGLYYSSGPGKVSPFMSEDERAGYFYGIEDGTKYRTWELSENDEIEVGQVFLQNDIIEMMWDRRGFWIPVKIRVDKAHPNGYRTVASNWRMINDGVSLSHLTTGTYYPASRSREPDEMTKKHNSIKQTLIKTAASGRSDTLRIIDLGCGRGNDIGKWVEVAKSKPTTNFEYVGIDIDSTNIITAKKTIDTHMIPKNIKFRFYEGNCASPFETQANLGMLGKFDIAVSFFSFHYYLDSRTNYSNLLKNISGVLKKDGYMIVTCFSGQKTTALLRSKPEISSPRDEPGKDPIWIIKPGKGYGGEGVFGKKIDVFYNRISTVGSFHPENLVFFPDETTDADIPSELDPSSFGLTYKSEQTNLFKLEPKLSKEYKTFSELNMIFYLHGPEAKPILLPVVASSSAKPPATAAANPPVTVAAAAKPPVVPGVVRRVPAKRPDAVGDTEAKDPATAKPPAAATAKPPASDAEAPAKPTGSKQFGLRSSKK
jgi:mRNA capping enzyme/mRNA capping enzyme, C-terminal domain